MGVFGRSALLPTKGEYISTYAGLPLEQTEKFLTDSRQRYYENIATTGKIGAAIAQLDLLDKDNPLRDTWKKNIDEHIQGVAKDENAWENAGFQTAMMAANFAGDDGVQLGLRNKVDYDEYVKGLQSGMDRGRMNQLQFEHYKNKALSDYQGAAGGEGISKHFGTPAEAVDIQQKIAQFKAIKSADFENGEWKFNETQGYYEKHSGEIMRPADIRTELREFLMADPKTRLYVDEMEQLDPDYLNQLQLTINGAAEAMGYDKRGHDIKFAPKYKSGTSVGTKSSEKYLVSNMYGLVDNPEVAVTSPQDYYLQGAHGNEKIRLAEEGRVKALTDFEAKVDRYRKPMTEQEQAVGKYENEQDAEQIYGVVRSKDQTHQIIMDLRTGKPAAIDDLPPAIKNARATYLTETIQYTNMKRLVEEKMGVDDNIYDIAKNNASAAYETANSEKAPDDETVQKVIEQYELVSKTEHIVDILTRMGSSVTAEVLGMPEPARSRDGTAIWTSTQKEELVQRILNGDESLTDLLTGSELEEVKTLTRADIENTDRIINYMSGVGGQGLGEYFSILNKEIKKFESPGTRSQVTHVFNYPGKNQDLVNIAKAQMGSGSGAAEFIQQYAPQWYGTSFPNDDRTVSADQIKSIQENGQFDLEGWVFDKRDGVFKIIYRVSETEKGFIEGFMDETTQRRIALPMPEDFETRLISDVAFKEVSGSDYTGATKSVKSLIRAKAFQAWKDKTDIGQKVSAGTSAGTTREIEFGKNDVSFKTNIGNISLSYTPGQQGLAPSYIVSVMSGGENREIPAINEDHAVEVIYNLLAWSGQKAAKENAQRLADIEAAKNESQQ